MSTPPALARWHQLVVSRDASALPALIADAAVFHSPVVHSPQVGKPLVQAYLAAALQVLGHDSFRYLHEWVSADSAVLEFQVDLDGLSINGVDMLRWNAAGQIVEFKVMLRPLKAIQWVQQQMAQRLQAR